MEEKKLKLKYPVIVEGKYDRLRLLSVAEGQILTTDGFGVFKKKEKLALFRALAAKTPLIVLSLTGFFKICVSAVFIVLCHMDVDGAALSTINPQITWNIISFNSLISTFLFCFFHWKNVLSPTSMTKLIC